jgi:hypothetical protein
VEEPLRNLIIERGFEQHQNILKERFALNGVAYSYTYCEPTSNPAIVINLETKKLVGRMTAWVLGTCYLEVLDVESGKAVYDRHYLLPTEYDFHDKLDEIARFINEQQIIDLLASFINGEDRSSRWADKLGVMLDELYPDDDQFQDVVLALASYNRNGGDYLYDEKMIFPLCKGAFDRLAKEKTK